MAGLKTLFRRGEPAIWFSGAGLGVSLLLIGGMVALILIKGFGFFWPGALAEVTLRDGRVLLGEIVAREGIPAPGTAEHLQRDRLQMKLGNRDITGVDVTWIDEDDIVATTYPDTAVYVERLEYGPFIGLPVQLVEADGRVTAGAEAVLAALPAVLRQASSDRADIRRLERDDVGGVNHRIGQARLGLRALDLEASTGPGVDHAARRAAVERDLSALEAAYLSLEARLATALEGASRARLTLRASGGEEKDLPALDVFRLYPANHLTWAGRAGVYGSRLWEFLSGDPRESNTEGGIFPAMFGTVMMVLIMSLVAVPFGVLAALYLREYARQGVVVRVVRIAVNNLAGVPSIVFGVFGLGFFVYVVGGTLDQAFYPERLPAPTFGTGGLLWASLTLALVTVPVVIVASEEALAAVPRSMREASLAMGATKFQTVLRVVLPAAAPGVLTGLILAMARGAGEVAPLMITGVVKLAPDLPLDSYFPFLHLDRKFMHLGFHIYDVGFQSPNVEAAKPMVYATAGLLLVVVLVLNLTAIMVRNRLRKRYQTSAFS